MIFLLIKQITELFLAMLMGFVLVRVRLLKAEDSKVLSIIVLYLVMPSVIVNAFQVEFTETIQNGLLLAITVAAIINFALLFLMKIVGKILRLDSVEKASIIYSNAGNLVIPIVSSILGKEWIIYSSAFISVQLILLWTHGRMLLCGERKFNIKKIISNVNMIAMLIGFILLATGIKLPDVITGTMESISTMIGPLSMIVTGMLLANLKISKVLSYRRIYFVTFLKMILCPLLILVFLKFSGFGDLHPEACYDYSNGIIHNANGANLWKRCRVCKCNQCYDDRSEYNYYACYGITISNLNE
ncbi:AEC family transporter [Clostridium sp.]|uniref:AEC family transporter n=1 Tax=Clostridium sp. TaxID=1506 RepID=UPI002A65F87B|nr:putative permease [Clostridium sp.]